MEKCEKIGPETYLPRPDCDGTRKYDVPSPPERDVGLTQAELEEYTRSYEDPTYTHVWFLYSMSPRLLYIIVLRIKGDRLLCLYSTLNGLINNIAFLPLNYMIQLKIALNCRWNFAFHVNIYLKGD